MTAANTDAYTTAASDLIKASGADVVRVSQLGGMITALANWKGLDMDGELKRMEAAAKDLFEELFDGATEEVRNLASTFVIQATIL